MKKSVLRAFVSNCRRADLCPRLYWWQADFNESEMSSDFSVVSDGTDWKK